MLLFSNLPSINGYALTGFFLLACSLLYIGIVMKPRLPRYKPQAIMTSNEREFFGRLRTALPEHFIFPQVAMSALITPVVPARDRRHRAAFARISQKRVDYAVYDKDLNLVCIVELDDRTHDAKKDAIRDALLSSAGIKTIRWHSKNRPSVTSIMTTILPPPEPELTAGAAR